MGATHVLASGDVTGDYRISSGDFELYHDGTNTVIRARVVTITLTSSDTTLTGKGANSDQDLTDGSSVASVIVASSFNLSSGNLHTAGDITVQAGATTGTIRANNIVVTSATVGALRVAGAGNISITQNDNSAAGGNLSLGGALTGGGTGTLSITNNDSNSAIGVNNSSNTISGFSSLSLAGSGSFTLDANLSIGSLALSSSLTGSKNLTVTGNTTAGAGQLNISGTLTLQGQTSDLTLGDNVTTLNLQAKNSNTEGAITLGSGAVNATVTITHDPQFGTQTYSGNLTGSGDDNLSMSDITFRGTATGFDTLTVNSSINIHGNITISGNTNTGGLFGGINGGGHLTTGTISGAAASSFGIRQLTITGNQTSDFSSSPYGAISQTFTLAGGGSGAVDVSKGDDTIVVSSNYTGNLTGGLGTDTLKLTGGTVSGTLSGFEKFEVTTDATTSVLDSDLTVSGSTTISGALQIASGHSLTTGSGAGVSNQVQSGGTLDISQLADETAGIGSNGITVAAGGTLVLGTAKKRNASNITLTKHATSSSTITLNLGTVSPSNTDAIFHTEPSFTGTGTVALSISGSLASGATHVLASGNVTGDYRIGSGNFELHHDGTNTVIRGVRITLTSLDTTLTGKGPASDQDLTDGTSTFLVVVEGSFNLSSGNLRTAGDIVVQTGATTGTISANNIIVTSATVGALTVTGSGNISITQNDNAGIGGNLSLGGAVTGGGTGVLSFTNNDSNSAIVLNASGATISGFASLSLAGTGGFSLNNNLTISGNTALGAVLSGTGHLTTATLSGSSNPNIATLTITGSQSDAVSFGSGVNTVTLSGGGSGAINFGGGDDVVSLSAGYSGALDGGAGTDSLTLSSFSSDFGTITLSNFETLELSATASAAGTFALTGSGGITLNQTLADSQVNKLTYNFSTTATSDTLNLSGSYTRVLAAKAGGVELGVLTGLDTLNITGDIDVRSGGSAAAWLHIGNALFRAVDNVARTINISGDITLRSISAPTTLGGGNFNQAGSMVGFQLTRRFTNLGATTDGASTIVITGSVNAILDGTDNNFWRLQNSLGFALGDQADTVTFRNSNSRVVRGELVRFGAGSDTLVLDSTSGSSSLTGILRGSNGGAAHVGPGIYNLGTNANNNHEVGYFSNPFTGLETLRKTGTGTYLLGFSVALGEVISRTANQFSSAVTVAGTNVNIEAGTLIVAGDDGSDTTESGFSADGASADASAVLRAGSFTISDGASLQLGQVETIGSWQVTRAGSVTGAVTINSGGRLDVEAGGSVTGTVTVSSGGILDIGTRRGLSGATVIANNAGADGVSFTSGGILEIAYASGGTVFSDAGVLDGSETLTINITGMTAGQHITLIGTGVTTGTGSNYTLQVDGSSSSGFTIDTTTTSGAIILRLGTVSASGVTIAGDATRTVRVGDIEVLVATVAPADATNKAVTWVSSDPTKARVDSNGRVTFLATGSVTITVTATDGSHTASVAYTVNAALAIVSTLGGGNIVNNSFSGTSTSAQALVVNGTLNLSGTATLKATTVAFSGIDKITGGTGSTIEISGAITTVSSDNTIDVENIKFQTGSSGTVYGGDSANTITISGGSAAVNAGGGNDIVTISASYSGTLDGEAGTDTLKLTGGTFTGSMSNFEVLDISGLAASTAGVGATGAITLAAGGVLAIGTAENRNASNITLTRGSDVASSSVISLDLGTDASSSSTALFSQLPAFTGTGAVTLRVSGNLTVGATQVLASGNDQTGNFRVRSGDPVEVVYVGSNTVLRGINVAPVIATAGGVSFSVAENQTSAFSVVASDRNGQSLTYELSGADSALFSVDTSGVVTFSAAADYELPSDAGGNNVYNVIVTVKDGQTPELSDSQAYTIRVTDVVDPTSGFTSGADTQTLASLTSGTGIDAGGGVDSLSITTFDSDVSTVVISNLENLSLSATGVAAGTFDLTASGGITLRQTLASSAVNTLTYNFSTTDTTDTLHIRGNYKRELDVGRGGIELGIFRGLDRLDITGDINVRVGGVGVDYQLVGYALFRAVDRVNRTINISGNITLRGIGSFYDYVRGGSIVGFQLTKTHTNLGAPTDGASTIVITGSVNALVERPGHYNDQFAASSVGFALGNQADTVIFRNSNSRINFGQLVQFGGGNDTLILDSTSGMSSLTGILRDYSTGLTRVVSGIYNILGYSESIEEITLTRNPLTGLETLRKTGAGAYLLGFSVRLGQITWHYNNRFGTTYQTGPTNVNIEEGTLIVAGDDGSDTAESSFSADGASRDARALLHAGSFTVKDGASLQLGQIETIGIYTITRTGSVIGAVTINSGGRLDMEAPNGQVVGTVTVDSGGILDVGTRRNLRTISLANNGGVSGVSFASGGGGILEIAYGNGGMIFSDATVLDGSETLTINVTGITEGQAIVLVGLGSGDGSNYTLQVDGQANSNFVVSSNADAAVYTSSSVSLDFAGGSSLGDWRAVSQVRDGNTASGGWVSGSFAPASPRTINLDFDLGSSRKINTVLVWADLVGEFNSSSYDKRHRGFLFVGQCEFYISG